MIVLAAGGTGGHLFPAEALARDLIGRGFAVHLATDRRGGTFAVDGVPTHQVPSGRTGPGLAAKLKAILGLAKGVIAAALLLRRLKPGVVVGFGGYPSLPTVLAAQWLGIPTIIHEQNAVLGRANALLARRARHVATHFPAVQGLRTADRQKQAVVGNPVRPAIQAIRAEAYHPPSPEGAINLLIIGGSQGARILSDIVPGALKSLPDRLKARLKISQQVRASDQARVADAYATSGLTPEIQGFFHDIPARLGAAHLVIARSGGSTVAELTTTGRPAILIPFAAAIADEQTANARVLVEAGAAWMIMEQDLSYTALGGLIESLLDAPARLAHAAETAATLGRPTAARDLADLVVTLAQKDPSP